MTETEREMWWETAGDVLEIVIVIGLIVLFGWIARECIALAEVA